VLQNLDEKSENSTGSQRSLSSTRENTGHDFLKIHRKSETLAQNITEQKLKIQKIYENLKFSVDRSNLVLSSRLSRERSQTSCTPNELDFSISREMNQSKDKV
jgi:SMC interacting uncharacterized protein involved in chromosome segregation